MVAALYVQHLDKLSYQHPIDKNLKDSDLESMTAHVIKADISDPHQLQTAVYGVANEAGAAYHFISRRSRFGSLRE